MQKYLTTILIWGFLVASGFAQGVCPLNTNLKPKEIKSFEVWKRIAILDEGRIKPLDTYAKTLLLQFSSQQTFDRKSAIEWFARLVFAPETTVDDKIFLINNPEIPEALGLEVEKKRRYSFAQIETKFEKLIQLAQSVLNIEEKKRSIVEQEIIRLYSNISLYAKLSHSLRFAFPHPDFTITSPAILKQLEFPEGENQLSFLDVALKAEQLRQISASLEHKDTARWNEEDKEILNLISNLFNWSVTYTNLPLSIVPTSASGDETWLSPWDTIAIDFPSQQIRNEMLLLRDMMVHYWNGEQLEFDIASKAFINSTSQRVSSSQKRAIAMINLEVMYNQLKLFSCAKSFYFLSFFIFLFSLALIQKFWHKLALATLSIGFLLHLLALVMRILILARPPVSNLYETFIFVGFISVLLGLMIELFNKNWLGILLSSIAGIIFLSVADKFSAEGDTLKMLVAVLNSNFWLSTHVLSITIGYAGCCAAGIMGHVYLIQAATKSNDKKLLNTTYKTVLGILGFGLTMTFLGTNLGGIWADQSWGRFWGWDPKENGALLIILWTAIIFHARIAGFIGPLGVAVCSILGIIVVMWAWFGVNLLSTGLHSYGFTSGAALNLILYVVLQISFILVMVPIIKKRQSR